ncbi:A/G-specific adenine glycosylase [Moraxella marmotae]|uniref:A/G-specific adenine glycosylase n=1 Tax=Moraxella marmotae TaxID=3344520 RepID=UPI0035F2E7CD
MTTTDHTACIAQASDLPNLPNLAELSELSNLPSPSEPSSVPSDTQHDKVGDDGDFAKRLLAWFVVHGRHDLPWQYHHADTADIYAVWLSEIMLQQTQVVTVLGFFERFLQKFPTVQALAAADWQTVAPLWAGLGYYARARNLHAGARQVVQFINEYGRYPSSVAEWQSIKGVGRSTAGAIVAMGVRDFGVICDGNVKRVLTRHRAITGDITKSATDKQLWALAIQLTPSQDSGRYAQAMMDLGATVCTRSRPKCELCPVSADCQAFINGSQSQFPVKKKAAPKPHRHSIALAVVCQDGLSENMPSQDILQNSNLPMQTLWLHRQNHGGIWDGLWCLPLFALPADMDKAMSDESLQVALARLWQSGGDDVSLDLPERQLLDLLPMPMIGDTQIVKIRHSLTHFHWHLYRLAVMVNAEQFSQINQVLNAVGSQYQWSDGGSLAKPAAMQKLMA